MIPQPRNEDGSTDERALYSVPDAARLLSISPKKAWQLVWSGELGSVRIGTRRLVPADAIPVFVASLPSGQTAVGVAA